MKYIGIDGDDVGAKLELFLLQNDERKIAEFSRSVENTVRRLESQARELDLEVIFCAGDSLLCKGQEQALGKLIRILNFQQESLSFSAGIGNTIKDAYIALKYAKASGKNMIINLDAGIYALWVEND
ncbi:mCpol domain-containing protein [Oscillatoria sp. CS-180]|uniref:mCpol domain-containing protein n=1 Tax=Oscillatoria sp. CS-180 TaxID=3021720 RepID=UPI00232B90F1|nr:mCpol domain-containing protein [Oscillatoria sp. CS-180]MDB9526779.1 mCpol domain-containing protein [Oscillatoria sp. CS-180]